VLPERGPLADRIEDAGGEVCVHPLAVLRRVLFHPRGAVQLSRAVRRDRRQLGALARDRDVALVHDNTSVVLSGRAVSRAAGVPHLMHVREIYAGAGGPVASALWPLMRAHLLRADALVCISRAVARQFSGSTRARVLHDGLPRAAEARDRQQARASLGIPSERLAVALVGRVSDWKGQDVLLHALAETPLVERGAIALLAGDAVPGAEDLPHRLELLAGRLGVAERVRWLGFHNDADAIWAAADVAVVPSTRPEPLGLVAIEAAAAGLPVVASAHGGVAEVVRDGQTGLLVPPGDATALATAVRLLADDPDLAARMGQAGRRRVEKHFGVGRMLAELQALYDELAPASVSG
jgi:glycosyltransferase involved in cell wall biosynthesis